MFIDSFEELIVVELKNLYTLNVYYYLMCFEFEIPNKAKYKNKNEIVEDREMSLTWKIRRTCDSFSKLNHSFIFCFAHYICLMNINAIEFESNQSERRFWENSKEILSLTSELSYFQILLGSLE